MSRRFASRHFTSSYVSNTLNYHLMIPTDDLMVIEGSWLSHQLINLEGAKSSTRYSFTRHYHNSVIISRLCCPKRRESSAAEPSNLNQYAQSGPRSRFLLLFFDSHHHRRGEKKNGEHPAADLEHVLAIHSICLHVRFLVFLTRNIK